ncbi:hypothetical protein LTR84_010429 [Exophiala bonariae]|uniref:DUF2264 domain-containing protein n=1 Tax=Exophiala bonariae TaxID=1690606 RepID=A0AAV9MWQ4_9EURO|nr:hypothetical protein LTR84_010429 [Exophiala bonariae]
MAESSRSPPYFTDLNSPLETRAQVLEACKSLLTPLIPFFSSGRTRLRLGATATRYDETGAQLEGFTRPMWGLGALLASGDTFSGTELWLDGLRNGTNPEHPEFWGYAKDLDQRMVEMCPMGFALCVAPKQLWDPLTEKEKSNVQKWLGWINNREMPNTNWLWFRVFANLALKTNGAEYSPERLEADLDHLDTFYRGDGWSNDGPSSHRQMDYYSGSFAIQLLQLLYVKINGHDDKERAEEYKTRAKLFAKDFVHYWDEEGRGITFGRSLTYRFATAGFWSAVAFAELDLDPPFTCGVVKGLLLRNLRHWSQQKDILTHSGLLTIGYNYPNQFLSENYNSPGSTYWFMLGFVALALPESHAFWQAKEEPFPTASVSKVVALKHPLHIMVNKGGHTFLLSSGQACHYPVRASESKYGKFAYSSAFGYSVPTGGYFVEAIGGDSMIAFSDDEGESWKVRKQPLDARLETVDGSPILVSSWKPWKDVSVETYLIPPTDNSPNWHLRAHHLITKRALKSSEGAFALHGVSAKDERELQALDAQESEGRLETHDSSLAVSRGGVVGIVELHQSKLRAGKALDEDANSNLTESRSVLPSLRADFAAESDSWLVTAVYALPASAEADQTGWQSGWKTRPEIPSWLAEKVKAK